MKMTRPDFDDMLGSIRSYFEQCKGLPDEPTFSERQHQFKIAGYTEERFRWDCLWRSGHVCRHLYAYLNDSHINTALKAIVRILKKLPPEED